MWRALAQVGIKVLENQAIKIEPGGEPLWIVGLADKTMRKIDLAAVWHKLRNINRLSY
ncbi:MAG: hypothetical protein R3E08_00025 [Thiotrichaceae bacterium]